jgi:DNA polymerase III sliding clamp (beta) subunit (PCNA family)
VTGFFHLTKRKKYMNTEIKVPAAELKTALAGLGKVINRSATLPVLGCVRVDYHSHGELHLQGTNLDAFATNRIQSDSGTQPASFLVPFELLTKAVKSSGKGMVAFVVEGKETKLRTFIGNNPVDQKVEAPALEEWPPVPKFKQDRIRLDDTFKPTFKEALECASTDEARYVLNGVCLDVTDPKAHYVVSTNGRTLFSANSFLFDLPKSVIIPSHKFLGWTGFIEDGACSLLAEQQKESAWVELSTDNWTYIARQIDGNYPNWKQVVPNDEPKTKVILSPQAVKELLEVIPKLPGKEEENSPVSLVVSGNLLAIESKGRREEQGTKIPILDTTITGRNIRIALNRGYLASALRFGLSEIHLFDDLSPLILLKEGKKMVIMPVRPPAPVTEKESSKEPAKATEQTPPAQSTNPQPAITSTNTNEPQERNNMPKETNTQTTPEAGTTAFELLKTQIETIKETLKSVVGDLNEVLKTVTQAHKEKKTTEREMEAIRESLREIQQIKV